MHVWGRWQKAGFVTVVSGEMSVLDNRPRAILIVGRQPLASGRLALSCGDNRITGPPSRRRRRTAASPHWSHLSPRPRIIPQVLRLKWRSGAQRTGMTLQAGRRGGGRGRPLEPRVGSALEGGLAPWPLHARHPTPLCPAPHGCPMSKVLLRRGRSEPGRQGDARCLRGVTQLHPLIPYLRPHIPGAPAAP